VIPAKEIEEIKVEEKFVEETIIAKSKIVKEKRNRFKNFCLIFPSFK
jgi:hypothetical protein